MRYSPTARLARNYGGCAPIQLRWKRDVSGGKNYESPAAVVERKRIKRAEKSAAHFRRLQEKRERDLKRSETLRHLASMSPGGRLSQLATDSELNLDIVPAELIPAKDQLTEIDLERTLVPKLLARIGGRRGAWRPLRRMLESKST